MTRVRFISTFVMTIAFVLAVGCGKKTSDDGKPGPKPPAKPELGSEAEKEAKAEAVKRLNQIGEAIHEYERAHGQFPAGIVGPDGELGLSWRVQILPFLGEGELHSQFNLKENWNSEHNKPLIEKMPKVFESAGLAADPGETYLQAFFGDNAFIPPLYTNSLSPKAAKAPPAPKFAPGTFARGRKVTDITDGTSNTIAIGESLQGVFWTKPEEIPFFSYGGRLTVPPMGGPFEGGFHALMCDGSVRFIPTSLDEKTKVALVTVNRGDHVELPPTDPKTKTDSPENAVPDPKKGDTKSK